MPIGPKRPKRPRDPAQLAKLVVDIATGEVEERSETGFAKRARVAGQKGGPARSIALTPEQRSDIARNRSLSSTSPHSPRLERARGSSLHLAVQTALTFRPQISPHG
jgi:hypothetical protein